MLDELNGGIVILWEVEVKENFRNQGIATMLQQRLEKDMSKHGDTQIMLFYHFVDTTLNLFYTKMGYEIGDNLHVAWKTPN